MRTLHSLLPRSPTVSRARHLSARFFSGKHNRTRKINYVEFTSAVNTVCGALTVKEVAEEEEEEGRFNKTHPRGRKEGSRAPVSSEFKSFVSRGTYKMPF